MTKLILAFWAYRMKNNENRYNMNNLEDKITENKFDKAFSLIGDIYIRYITKIIKNEEKIYNDIFQKYNVGEKELIDEQEKIIKTKDEVKESIELVKNKLEEQKKEIIKCQKEIEEKRKQVANLEKRKKSIKNKKITYLQDLEENKNILDDKGGKKQYLNEMDAMIKKNNSEINKKSNDISELEDNIARDDTELKINNKKLKKIEEKINKLKISFQQNKYMMMFKLKKIREKWIDNISKDQKKFINFLKEINKLENIEFIKNIENFWKKEKDSIKKLNKDFNVENNLQIIKKENKKIEDKFKDDFKNLENDFKSKEEEIIKKAIEVKKEKFQESLRIINQSKLVNSETQTEINQENEKPSWQEQKIEEQKKTIEKLEFQMNDLEKKLISIKGIHEDEVKDLSTVLENVRIFFTVENKKSIENCNKLKDDLNKKNSKKEEQKIQNKLNEEEIKLTSLNEIWKLISTEIPELQQPSSKEAKDINKQKWSSMNVIESQLSSETKTEVANII